MVGRILKLIRSLFYKEQEDITSELLSEKTGKPI